MPHAELDADVGRVRLRTTWNQKQLVQQVPGARWDATGKHWTVPLTWASLVVLRGVFGDELTVDQSLSDWTWSEYRERVQPALELRDALAPVDDGSPEYQLIQSWIGRDGQRGLYDFQAAGTQFLLRAGSGLLGDEMGSGKTPQTLSLIRAHDELDGTGLPALVVCPNSVKHHWEREASTWCPRATPYVVDGTAAQRRKVLKAALDDPTALVIVNVESMRLFSRLAPYGSVRLARCRECDPTSGDEKLTASRCEVHPKELNAFKFQTVVMDEAHRCFPYTTKVLTDEGWLEIGDVVERGRATEMLSRSSTGVLEWRLITNRWRNPPSELIRVKHSAGELTCTADHKIWTDRGYQRAGDLVIGDVLRVVSRTIDQEDGNSILLQDVQQSCYRPRAKSTHQDDRVRALQEVVSNESTNSSILYTTVRESTQRSKRRDSSTNRCQEQQAEDRINVSMVQRDVSCSTVFQCKNVLLNFVQLETQASNDSQSNERSNRSREGTQITSGTTSLSTSSQRRQRSWTDEGAERSCRCSWLADGGDSSNQVDSASWNRSTVSQLQDRRCEHRVDDRDRSRRLVSSDSRAREIRSQEGLRVDAAWVECVEVYQPTGVDVAGRCTSDDHYLYDVEVADNHNYFANGVLVSNCKDPKTKQTRAIWYVAHRPSVRWRWGLTGTPIANHPGDLWSIMHFVAPDEAPTRSSWVDRFCLMSWNAFGGMDVVGVRPDTRDELFKIVDPRFRRMLKAVVLPQLPPKVRETRYVDLPTAQRRAYDQLATTLRTRLADGSLLLAANQLVVKTRLMQFAAAAVTVDKPDEDDVASWRVTLREPSPKLDVLEEVLDELGVLSPEPRPPVLVAAEYLDLVDLIGARLDRLGVRWAKITGDVAPIDRQRALDDLNAHRIRVLVFTGKAGGVGLNMSAADTLINVQRSWSLVDERQKEDRNHRVGSEVHDSVRIVDVVTRGTVEEDQVARLLEKLERLEEITRDRARLLAAGELSNAAIGYMDQREALVLHSAIDLDVDLNVTR